MKQNSKSQAGAKAQQSDEADEPTSSQTIAKPNVSRRLSYVEAQELSMQVEWKTNTCTQGEQCWCRIIEPKDKIVDADDNEIYIAGSGCVPTIYAEHIVNLHNRSLNGG